MYDCGRDYEKDMALEELEALRDKIVLCKDCKYWNKIDKAMYCTRHISIMHMGADDFCSRGEKR